MKKNPRLANIFKLALVAQRNQGARGQQEGLKLKDQRKDYKQKHLEAKEAGVEHRQGASMKTERGQRSRSRLGAPRGRMRWELLSKPRGCLWDLEEWTTDLVRNLHGKVGLLAGGRRRAEHGGDPQTRARRPFPSGSAMPGPQPPASVAWECLPGVMATEKPGLRSGRAVGWPLEVEEEGGGGGEGRGLVELEEARATTRRRRAAQALGPSQAVSLPAAGGWMGRLQAAAAAAEAAVPAVAVSAASTNHPPHPSIGNRSSRGARSPLSSASPPPRQSAARKTLDFRGGAARASAGRAGSSEALPPRAHAQLPPLPRPVFGPSRWQRRIPSLLPRHAGTTLRSEFAGRAGQLPPFSVGPRSAAGVWLPSHSPVAPPLCL